MKKILPLLLLVAVIFGAYSPALRNGFVWDDTALILRDPLIRSWRLIPEGFQHFLFTDATASDFYRPIQRLTYTFDYALFGFSPAPYHLASIAWHVAAALALFSAALELLRLLKAEEKTRTLAAFVATFVWALHPVQSGAVAYISGRADSLAAAFGFAGLYLALRALRTAGSSAWIFTIAAAVSFLLSALSKELGLIFLAAWLVIVLLQKQWKRSRGVGLGIIFVLAAYLSLRSPAEHIPPPAKAPVPALVRPIVVARAFAEYTALMVFPLNLHMERDVETRPTGFNRESTNASAWRELETLAGLLLMAAFIYWTVRERRRNPAVFLLLVLTLVTYLPVSGVYGLNATVAEHWLYLPSAFLFLAVTLRGVHMFERTRTRSHLLRPIALAVAVVWTLFLGGRTFARTFDWKDQRTFLERTMAQGGNSARMLINLAGLELKEDHLEEAKKHFLMALQKEPNQPLAVLGLAGVAVKQNDFATAHAQLAIAKDLPLVEAQAYELMTVLENKETGHANLMRMRLASRSGPPNWAIEKRYVKLLDEMGSTEGAIAELRACLVTQWYRADSWELLSELLSKGGHAQEAVAALERARRYDVRLSEHGTPGVAEGK